MPCHSFILSKLCVKTRFCPESCPLCALTGALRSEEMYGYAGQPGYQLQISLQHLVAGTSNAWMSMYWLVLDLFRLRLNLYRSLGLVRHRSAGIIDDSCLQVDSRFQFEVCMAAIAMELAIIFMICIKGVGCKPSRNLCLFLLGSTACHCTGTGIDYCLGMHAPQSRFWVEGFSMQDGKQLGQAPSGGSRGQRGRQASICLHICIGSVMEKN